MFHVKHDFFVAKALQAKNMLAQIFICRAQEQREARLRAVRVRNRVGVSLLDFFIHMFHVKHVRTLLFNINTRLYFYYVITYLINVIIYNCHFIMLMLY